MCFHNNIHPSKNNYVHILIFEKRSRGGGRLKNRQHWYMYSQISEVVKSLLKATKFERIDKTKRKNKFNGKPQLRETD